IRNPKEIRNPKSETTTRAHHGCSVFGIRISDFGFRIFTCDSLPRISARSPRAGIAAGAGGDLYFAESLSTATGFQLDAVAISDSIAGRRRADSSVATAAAVLSRTTG